MFFFFLVAASDGRRLSAARFLVIMSIFVLGFTLHVAAIYQPVRPMFTNGTDSGMGYPPNGKYTDPRPARQ